MHVSELLISICNSCWGEDGVGVGGLSNKEKNKPVENKIPRIFLLT